MTEACPDCGEGVTLEVSGTPPQSVAMSWEERGGAAVLVHHDNNACIRHLRRKIRTLDATIQEMQRRAYTEKRK